MSLICVFGCACVCAYCGLVKSVSCAIVSIDEFL